MLRSAVARLVNDLVAVGVTVYGPAVRDLLLAARHADGYAKAVADPVAGPSKLGDAAFYDVAHVLPQFWARTLAPREVSAYVGAEDVIACENALVASCLFVETVGVWGVHDHSGTLNDERNRAISRRYRVSLARPELVSHEAMMASLPPEMRASAEVRGAAERFAADIVASFAKDVDGGRRSVDLDLVVVPRAGHFRLPCAVYDVDGLCLDRRGVFLSVANRYDDVHARSTRLMDVLDAVYALRATYEPAPPGREHDAASAVALVTDAHWSVEPVVVVPGGAGAYEGHCIVCHDAVPEGQHHKLRCCDARYHSECLRATAQRVFVSRACIMCRRPVDPVSLYVDICRIQCAEGAGEEEVLNGGVDADGASSVEVQA